MYQLPKIRLNAPFTVRKVSKARAWRLVSAFVTLAFIGQTTMLVRALPGQNVGATDVPTLTSCSLYGYQDSGADDSQLFSMNLQTGNSANIGSTATDEDIEAIDTQPSTGTIFGFRGSVTTELVTIDPTTGARTPVGSSSDSFEMSSASFNPVSGELWGGANTDDLYVVNPTTGALTLKFDVDKSGEPQALAWNPTGTTLYVAYGSTSGTTIYTTNGTSALASFATVSDKEIEALEFEDNGNLLAGVHGSNNLYIVSANGTLIDTGKNFPGNDVETFTTRCAPPPVIVVNPPLGRACGLDIGLIIDVSGSVNSTEMSQMKSALTTFVDAFDGTPTEFSVVKFATDSSNVQSFTDNLDTVKTKIQNNVPSSGEGHTNWDSGLSRSFDTFDNGHLHRSAKPNLMVIATDGSPNRWGYPAANPSFDWNGGLQHAIPTANAIKTAGTRIVAIGIGGDPDDPDFPNVDFKFTSITGPHIAPPAAVDENADVIKTDFNQLGQAMANLANGLCGGKILVQKQFDTNGDGQADLDGSQTNALLGGWNFDVSGTPSDPDTQTTSTSGSLEFAVNNGTYSVTETNTKDRVALTNASCVNGQTPVGTFDANTRTVSGLTMNTDDTITCTFLNTNTTGDLKVIKHVVGSDSPSSDWMLHVQHNVPNSGGPKDPQQFRAASLQDVSGSPQPGSSTGTVYHLPAGAYDVSETGPDGYILTFAPTCVEGDVTVTIGQTVTCTLTNTRIPVPVFAVNLEKSGPATVDAGGTIIYSLAWSIGGDTAVHNAVLTDPIPANTSFVSANNGGTENTGTVTWNLGTKNPGDSGVVTVTVKANSPLANGTVLTNTACFDTTETNQTCDDTTTTVHAVPILAIEKTSTPTVVAGNNITYLLNWSVGGNATATNVVITDPIPANTTFVAADNSGTFSNGVVTWNLGTKNPGEHGTVSVTVKTAVPQPNGTVVTNNACIDASQTEPVCDSTTTTLTSSPILSITKSNSINLFTNPGASVIYTVVVANTATATDTAKAVVLTDVLPAGFVYDGTDSGTKTFALGDILPSASVTTTYVAKISTAQAAGIYTNTASAQGSNTVKVSVQSNVDVRVPAIQGLATPELTIVKTVDPTVTTPGSTITYTLKVTNPSDTKATNLKIVDTLPKGFTFLDDGKSTRTWTIASLAAGQSVNITFQVKLASSLTASKYTNIAVLTANDIGEQKAKVKVEVRVPRVLGLATTGVGPFDFLMFATGLGMFGTGFGLLRRFRYRHQG